MEDVAIADVAFEVRGDTVAKMFENAAMAFTMTTIEPEGLKNCIWKVIDLKCDNYERLLRDFLIELIFLKDTEGFVAKEIEVNIRNYPQYILSANLRGDKINSTHSTLSDVKAVTMHHFSVKKEKGIYKAVVVLDI